MNKRMKDSGIEWIGEIPEEWEVRKVKELFFRKKKEAKQEDPIVLTLSRNGVRIRDMSNNEGQIAENYYNYNQVEVGDFLLNPMDLYSGANCNVSSVAGVISPAYFNLVAKNGNIAKFSDYYFKTQYWAMAMFAHGKGVSYEHRWTLNNETLMNYFVPVPSIQNQQAIANFLDQKCSEIDHILEKTRESIEEYKKLKQSIITEAVTKGLDKNVEMKDSGIEWIGEIPKHWEVLQVKYIVRWKSENNNPDAVVLSLYRDFGIVPKDSRDDNHNVTSLDTSGYKVVNTGDLVINKMKAWQGSLAVSDYEGIVSPAYHVAEFINAKVNPKYFHHLMRNQVYLPEYRRLSTGMRIGQWDLSFDSFKNLNSIIPPKDEQLTIIEYIDNQSAIIDSLIAQKETLLTDLEAYKKSLIFECVTGKREVM